MAEAVQIREFQSDDATSVEFVVLSVLQEWGFLPTMRDQQELESLQVEHGFDAFYVAEDPVLGVVGCAGLHRINAETCELRKIYLLRRFRGRAIGRKLLDCVEEKARELGYKHMRLEVNSSITTSAPFYLRNGFMIHPFEVPKGPSADAVYYKPLVSHKNREYA